MLLTTFGSLNVELHDLIRALLASDALTARQWVADASRCGLQWRTMPKPALESRTELSLAAGIVELLAQRSGQTAPSWTAEVPGVQEDLYLVRAAQSMPHLRRLCVEEGPEPLRKRRIFAPPGFLTAA